jgi:hypothetical protein
VLASRRYRGVVSEQQNPGVAAASEPSARPVELGGDPACWLNRVCPDCGLLNDEHADACRDCGADLPD